MPSKAQRAVTDVPPERWGQLGKALQAWREDELGYQARIRFAADRYVNIRLVQDLEKNYRPGTYTKWALQDAAQAYKVTYESVLAFLDGKTNELARAEGAPARRFSSADMAGLPPSPFDDPARDAADLPFVAAIWERFLDLPRRVTEPSGAQMFPDDTDDARAWDGIGARLPLGDRVWFIADLRRRAAGRHAGPNAGTGTNGA